MDKAPDYGSGDSRFESWHGRIAAYFFALFFFFFFFVDCFSLSFFVNCFSLFFYQPFFQKKN